MDLMDILMIICAMWIAIQSCMCDGICMNVNFDVDVVYMYDVEWHDVKWMSSILYYEWNR